MEEFSISSVLEEESSIQFHTEVINFELANTMQLTRWIQFIVQLEKKNFNTSTIFFAVMIICNNSM